MSDEYSGPPSMPQQYPPQQYPPQQYPPQQYPSYPQPPQQYAPQQYPPQQYPSYPQPQQYPPQQYPQGPEPGVADVWRAAPRALRPVVVLLLVNLVLSLILTVVTLVLRHSIADYQLDHRHITDPGERAALRDSYTYGIVGRVVGNIVVSIVYAFIVRALVRGRRWAYRRVILVGALGIVGLLVIQASPYPPWMRVEQLVQAAVLAALLYFVLRPEVRSHFDPSLPGRNLRRFNR